MGDSSKSCIKINCDILSTLLNNTTELFPKPSLIFFLGDMVQGGSSVATQLDTWKSIVCNYYPLTMYYPCLGSHENNETAFSNAFPHLPNQQLPGYLRTVYYIDYENTRFVILNSNRRNKQGSYTINPLQQEWLDKTLSTSDKRYNFVMFHVPAFPTGHHYGECLDRTVSHRDALWEIIDKNKVTAVFVGHEHNYCRRMISKSSFIYQITTGGSGSSLNKRITDIDNVIVGPICTYHYVVLDIYDKEVNLKAYDINNNIIDSCRLNSCSLSVINQPF